MTTLTDNADAVNAFCARAAQSRLLVQGAGGNVSWKDQSTLWIKASGAWLRDALTRNIFVPVCLDHLTEALNQRRFDVVPLVKQDTSLRPSIETPLHALMPQKFVAHLHMVEALAHLVRDEDQPVVLEQVGREISAVLVDYHKPGADLAEAVSKSLAMGPNVNVVFLRNHGVVIGAETLNELERLMDRVSLYFQHDTALTEKADCASSLPEIAGYRPCTDDDIHRLARNSSLLQRLSHDWALYPDHVVFLGGAAVIVSAALSTREATKLAECGAPFIFVRERGALVSKIATDAHYAQILCYHDVVVRQVQGTKLRTLSEAQIAELIDWDAERYRRQLSGLPQ